MVNDFTTLLRPFGEKIRLKANFFLTSLDYMNYKILESAFFGLEGAFFGFAGEEFQTIVYLEVDFMLGFQG